MVKIRLMRTGKRKQPSYRVVVADSRSPRDGRIIEAIGHYRPRVEPSVIEIDNARALHWLQRGAQPSDQVKNLLRITGAWSEFTGEARPDSTPAAAAKGPTATPAASVKATAAASVAETEPGAAGADTIHDHGTPEGVKKEAPHVPADAVDEEPQSEPADEEGSGT